MQLDLSPDQEVFQETTHRFLERRYPPSEVRAGRANPAGFESSYWRQGAELGWTSLLVAEGDGGGSISGSGLKDLALVAYEFGRHASPGPLVPVNVVATAVSLWGTAEQRTALLPGMLAGTVVATWASSEPRPNDRLGAVTCTATPSANGYLLQGTKSPVEAAGQAEYLLVTARLPRGLANFLVGTDEPGVAITPMHGLDLSRRFASVQLNGVAVPESARLGEVGDAEHQVEHLLQISLAIQLAETVGAMDRCLEMTIEWAFSRYSFGRPLASYQELKHRFADMRAWLEAAHAIADEAADHVEAGSPRGGELASAGKAFLGVYGPELAQDCVQIHGGIGVTFDHNLHLYLRRIVTSSQLLGTVSDHRQRLARMLEGKGAHL